MRPTLVVVGAVAAVTMSGCTAAATRSGTTDPSSTPSAAVAPTTAPSTSSSDAAVIHIHDFSYTDVTVAPGATVTVHDMDGETHSVTSDQDGLFSVDAPPGRMVAFTAPSQPGRYPYHCVYHGNMHGVLTVS